MLTSASPVAPAAVTLPLFLPQAPPEIIHKNLNEALKAANIPGADGGTSVGQGSEVFSYSPMRRSIGVKGSAAVCRRCFRSRDPPTSGHGRQVSAMAAPAPERQVASAPRFPELVHASAAADVGRGGERTPPADPAAMFAGMLRRLETDALWAREYEDFVRAISFARPGEAIDFADAFAACIRLVAVAYEGT